MRNGPAYKIKALALQGVSTSDICKMPEFREYSAEEIKRFIPGSKVSESETPAPTPVKKVRKKASAKR